MAKKTANTPTFEQHMKRLQEIVLELERADLPLEENVSLYKEGQAIAQICKEMLDTARNEILLCIADGSETPFSSDNAGDGE